MKITFKKKTILLTFALAVALFVGSANAVTLVNGSMNTSVTPIDLNSFNTEKPDGWDITLGLGSTDIFDQNTNFSGFAWDASSDGGTFVHGLTFGSTNEGIGQTITGLTIGQKYVISFEQSISFYISSATGKDGLWDVTFGDTTLSSAPMTSPSSGTTSAWQDQTLIFTATATTQDLIFRANQADGVIANRLDLGLDGVSLVVIPVPASVWLFGSGLLGLVGIARRKKAA